MIRLRTYHFCLLLNQNTHCSYNPIITKALSVHVAHVNNQHGQKSSGLKGSSGTECKVSVYESGLQAALLFCLVWHVEFYQIM